MDRVSWRWFGVGAVFGGLVVSAAHAWTADVIRALDRSSSATGTTIAAAQPAAQTMPPASPQPHGGTSIPSVRAEDLPKPTVRVEDLPRR
jgi:hypothetical protein